MKGGGFILHPSAFVLPERQADDELAAATGPVAVRLDPAAVQRDQAAAQRQADAQPAAGAGQAAVALRERLEPLRRQQLGGDAGPVVTHPDDDLVALTR